MGTTSDKLVYLNDTKVLIHDAIEDMGSSIPTGTPFREYPDYILDIPAGQPQPDPTWTYPSEWPDIKAIFNADTTVNNKLYIALLLDTAPTMTSLTWPSAGATTGATYKLSDGYTTNTAAITHTWDQSQDISVTGKTYKLRWIIVGRSGVAANMSINLSNSTTFPVLALYCGGSQYASLTLGNSTATSANRIIRSVEFGGTSTATASFSPNFYNCASLMKVDMSSLTAVTSIPANDVFRSCTSLKDIRFPPNMTALTGGSLFTSCTSLQVLNLPTALTTMNGANVTNASGIEYINYTQAIVFASTTLFSTRIRKWSFLVKDTLDSFRSHSLLQDVYIEPGITTLGANFLASCLNLTSIAIPDSVTTISSSAFNGTGLIGDIVLPPNVTSLGNGAFTGCASVDRIFVPSGVTSLSGNTFSNCTSISYISIPGVTSVTSTDFSNCLVLVAISVANNFDSAITLSASSQLSTGGMVDLFTKLKDNTGLTAKTITLGATNLARLSAAEKLIATNKNWTLA